MSLPQAGVKALDSEDARRLAPRKVLDNEDLTTTNADCKKGFGRLLKFKAWADVDAESDFDEPATLADFGLEEEVNAVQFSCRSAAHKVVCYLRPKQRETGPRGI